MMQMGRPPTVPTPVTTPSAGVAGSTLRANSQSSWNSEPGSRRSLSRARTKSLPSARGLWAELERVAHEALALGPKLVAVAGMALLDPGAFLAVALLARAHRVVAPITAGGSSRE